MSENMSRRDFLRLSAVVALEAAVLSAGLPSSAMAMALGKGNGKDDDLAFLPAAEQIRRFKAGSLSPLDVLEAQIARINKFNGPLNLTGDEIPDYMNFNGMVNAITREYFDDARKAAKDAEARYRNGTARPLEGITVAVKDDNDVKGWRVSMGSITRKDAPLVEENDEVVDMMLSDGAILHIQTTVPEFYLHIQTWTKLWGVTRNPWNLHYAVGGSSGGSGAALAAGFATLATGSDMGGSIRIPSSLCGAYGFRPPFGRVPSGENPFVSYGPMARTFDDMILMQESIGGPHPGSHTSLRPKLSYPRTYESLKGVKIALDYFDGWVDGGIDDSVRKAMTDAAQVLRSQGAIVEEVDLGWRTRDLMDDYINGLLATDVGDMLAEAKGKESLLTSYVARSLAVLSAKGAAESAIANQLAASLHRNVQTKVFGKGYLSLLTPTLTTTSIDAEFDPGADASSQFSKPTDSIGLAITYPWNLLNRYPVINVPIGLAENNIPVGMQVIGNTYDDIAACRVAYGYSRDGVRLYEGGQFPDYRNRE